METKWIVERVEEHGQSTRTLELDELEASSLYSNWANHAARYHDQSVALIRVERAEFVISRLVNTRSR